MKIKTQYHIFSKDPTQLIIAAFVLFTVSGLIYLVGPEFVEQIKIWRYTGVYLLLFSVLSLFLIVALNSCIFPIIKIDNEGVTARSIFWKRKIKWAEVNCLNRIGVFVCSRSRNSRNYVTFSSLEMVPRAQSSFSTRSAIFAIISTENNYMPQSKLLLPFLMHRHIANKNTIAFECGNRTFDVLKTLKERATL